MKLRDSARCGAALTVMVVVSRALASAPPPIVRVYVAGAPEAVSGSRDAIQDVCSRSNVAVVVRDAAGADEALLATERAPGLAEAYVDLRPGTAPRVVVVDGETRQDLERRTLPEGSSLDVSIETVARVVCSAVESSLAARAAAVRAADAPAEARPTPARERAARDSPFAPRVDVFGAAQNLGAGFHGGAGAALDTTYGRGSLRVGALLSFAGYAAVNVDAGAALASFGVLGVRALPLLEWHASSDVTAFVGLGGGGDWTRVSTEGAPNGSTAVGATTTFDPVIAGILGTRLRISRSLSALLAFDADVALARHRYVIISAGGSRPLFEPSRVRPMALAGLSLSFGGPDADSSTQQMEARQ